MANSIDKIPNSISGDGSSFVAQLKKALGDLRTDAADINEGDTSAYCQPVTNVTLTQRKQGNDNFIDVSWNKESVYGYKEAFVFYRPISSARWQLAFDTEETNGVIEGVSVGVRYAVKVVPHNIDGGYDKNPTEYYIDVVSSMEAPTTPTQFFVNFDSGEGHWEWKYEGPYDFFELRTDTNVGVTNEYLLARTNRKEVFKEPNILQGTAYLYVRNNFGVYSVPATTTFNISEENKPPKPSISRGLNGINIHMTPNEAYGSYVVQVEELEYETNDNPFYLPRTHGALRTRYRWRKGTAYSGWSNWIIVNISELIDTEDLADNCITTDKLASGSVTAGKLFAGNIDLAGSLAIVGGAVTLNENGLRCSNTNNGDSVILDSNGLRFVDVNDNAYSSIGRMIIGQADDGDTVVFNTPWTSTPYVLVMPQRFQTSYDGFSSVNLETICRAINISNEGFTVQCQTAVLSGSSGGGTNGFEIGYYSQPRAGTYQLGTLKELNVPTGATHLSIDVLAKYEAPCDYTAGDPDSLVSVGGRTYVWFEVLVNGVIAKTYTTPTTANYDNTTTNKSTIEVDFVSGDIVQIRAYTKITANSGFSVYAYAQAYVDNYRFSVGAGDDFIVGSGKATFIALETLNADYSIE